jgi:hypothetical protein
LDMQRNVTEIVGREDAPLVAYWINQPQKSPAISGANWVFGDC